MVHYFSSKRPAGESGFNMFRKQAVGVNDVNLGFQRYGDLKFELVNLDFFYRQWRPTSTGELVSEGACPFPGYKMGPGQPTWA